MMVIAMIMTMVMVMMIAITITMMVMMIILITLINSHTYEIYYNLKSVSNKVDGGLTNWTNASECSKTCGGGTQNQTRTCSNPPPAFGGRNCTGETLRTIYCFVRECPGT